MNKSAKLKEITDNFNWHHRILRLHFNIVNDVCVW